jgi:hypothetical protein
MSFRDVEPWRKLQSARISRELHNRDDTDSAILQQYNKANTCGTR